MRKNYTEIAKLVQQVKAGDMDAFTSLYEETNRWVYQLSYQYLQNVEDANDAVQEVYIKVFSNLNRLTDEMNFIAWLNKITHNTNRRIAEKRKLPTQEDVDLESISDSGNDPVAELLERERNEGVYSLLDTLNPTLRTIVVLRYFHNFKMSDIAIAMKCPVGTVKSRLNAARRKLLTSGESLRWRAMP